MKNWRTIGIAALATFIVATIAWAAAPGVINAYNALCSSNFATRCVLVNADGSVPTTPAAGVVSDVNVTQVAGAAVATGHGTAAGALRVELPTDGTGVVGLVTGSTVTSRIVGNGGATLDSTVGAGTAPIDMLAVGGVYNSTEISPTTGQSAALQLDSKGRQRTVLMDAAGNTRGANVNASSQLSISVDNNPVLGAGSAVIGHVVADSGSTTAVTQSTAANLNATVVGGSTAADTAALTAALKTWSILGGFNGSTSDLIRSGDVANSSAATGYLDALTVAQYNATIPTLTDTRFDTLELGLRGGLHVDLYAADSANAIGASQGAADGVSGGFVGYVTIPENYISNGTTWDRQAGVVNGTNSTGTGIPASGNIAQCDDTTPVTVTENQFGNVRLDCTSHALMVQPANFSFLRVTADTQVKATAGFVHTVCFEPTTATPTAGLVTVYDSAAESGTQLLSKWFFATNPGQCETLDVRAGTGIYVGYDATVTNMSVTVTYR